MTCIEEERVVNLISTCHGVTVPTIFGNLTKICFEDGFESQNASKGDFLKPSGWFAYNYHWIQAGHAVLFCE